MIPERMLEMIILRTIIVDYSDLESYRDFIDENYDILKMQKRYLELGKEFLNDYAIDKQEKS